MKVYAIATSAKQALREFWAGGYESLAEAQMALAAEQAHDPSGQYDIYSIVVEVVQE